MARAGRDSTRRLKTAKKRKASSQRWLERQINDPYVKQAIDQGWRSRAAFKLMGLDDRFKLVKDTKRVVDLGIAPGGWAQVVRERSPRAAIVGIDLLETEAIEGVTILQMDFMDDDAPNRLMAELGGAPDLVMSDMAANTVGHKQTDHLRTMGLVEAAAWFAVDVLEKDGNFVAKGFAGGTDTQLLTLLKAHFKSVKHAKPPASRKGSSEWYVVAKGFKGRDVSEEEGEEGEE